MRWQPCYWGWFGVLMYIETEYYYDACQDVKLPTLWLLVALQVVVMTTCSATSDHKVGIMTTLSFQCIEY